MIIIILCFYKVCRFTEIILQFYSESGNDELMLIFYTMTITYTKIRQIVLNIIYDEEVWYLILKQYVSFGRKGPADNNLHR